MFLDIRGYKNFFFQLFLDEENNYSNCIAMFSTQHKLQRPFDRYKLNYLFNSCILVSINQSSHYFWSFGKYIYCYEREREGGLIQIDFNYVWDIVCTFLVVTSFKSFLFTQNLVVHTCSPSG